MKAGSARARSGNQLDVEVLVNPTDRGGLRGFRSRIAQTNDDLLSLVDVNHVDVRLVGDPAHLLAIERKGQDDRLADRVVEVIDVVRLAQDRSEALGEL